MATVTELANDLCSGDQVKTYQAQQALARLSGEIGATGKEAEKAEAAKALAAVLAGVKPAKDNRGEPTLDSIKAVNSANELCRALSLLAGEAEVVVLAECLKNIDLRETARWCLTRMTCQGAADALVEAYKTATGTEYRVGLVNALGRKQGSNVLETLKIAAADKEPEVALAAVEALANTPDAALDAVISGVESGSSSRRAARVARARVRLGSTLLRAGDDAGAKQVFTAVAGADVDEAPKKAAAAAVGG